MPSPKDPRRVSANYRKPPAEFQFKKGETGNRNGRPKKKTVQGDVGGIGDRLSKMVLDEANRPITVREGDTVVEMPAMQALLRTMFKVAAQGDPRAARQLMDVVARAESGRAVAAKEFLAQAVRYKKEYLPIFAKHERQGLDPPDIYPHPDDFVINEDTGEVTIDGPMSREQAGARKAVHEQALEEMPRYFELQKALAKDPKNRELRKEFKELQKYFDFLQKDSDRDMRHTALRESRRALNAKPAEQDDGESDEPIEQDGGSDDLVEQDEQLDDPVEGEESDIPSR